MSNETKKTETTETLMGPPAPKIEKYDHIGHVYLIVVAAIVSYAVTEIVKPFIFKTCAEKSEAVRVIIAEIMTIIVSTTLFDCMRPYVDNIVNICKALCMDPYGEVIIEGTKAISEFSKAGGD